ncbi:MAG: Na+/H+ antiporter subunit E [Rubrivivax sp.]|nr:Na+/H+ antiporter subunit E [Rubrivivax sp.]
MSATPRAKQAQASLRSGGPPPATHRAMWPSPLISALLFVAWPVLNQSWSLGQLLLGLALAWALPWWAQRLRSDKPRIGRPGVILKLGLTVLKDIVTSNIEVARLILGPEQRIRPAFLWLPLSITDAHGIVALAGIITMTPGTLSADIAPDRRHLLIHAFDVGDDAAAQAALIATIKARYEAPLLEIFGA